MKHLLLSACLTATLVGCAACRGPGVGWRFEVDRPSVVYSTAIAQPQAGRFEITPLGTSSVPIAAADPCAPATLAELARVLGNIDIRLQQLERARPERIGPPKIVECR